MTGTGTIPEFEVSRMVSAIRLGDIADREFARACARLSIDPRVAIASPLNFIALNQRPKGRA